MLGAELLKLRKRWASYVVLLLLIGLMSLVFLLVGFSGRGSGGAGLVIGFPGSFGVINQFVFGLGSLLAVAYSAAIGGADWNWGVIRVIVARGESRSRFMLVKFAALVIVLLIGVLIAYLAGIILTYLAAASAGVSAGSPFTSSALQDLVESIALGFPVLVQRAAIGFAVAVLLRSQLAGVVVGIILYIGEAILSAVLLASSLGGIFEGEIERLGTQWYQFLPISIGDSVLSRASGIAGQNFEDLLLTPVPLETALLVASIYLVAALAVVVVSVERSEIGS